MFVKNGGVWAKVRGLWIKDAGVWKKVSVSVPGSASYTTPGDYTFYVPDYETISIDVMAGSGGGGGGSDHYPFLYCYAGGKGSPGGESRFQAPLNVYATPGGGGDEGSCGGTPYPGANGIGVNGDTDTTGYGGGAGGQGSGPGGVDSNGRPGGASGRALKTWSYGSTSGFPEPGVGLLVRVGGGGGGGFPGRNCSPGGDGANGYVNISWT